MSRALIGACVGTLRYPQPVSSAVRGLYASFANNHLEPAPTDLVAALDKLKPKLHYAAWLPVFHVSNALQTASKAVEFGGQGHHLTRRASLVSDAGGAWAVLVDGSLDPNDTSPHTSSKETGVSTHEDIVPLHTPYVSHGAKLPARVGDLCWLDVTTGDGMEESTAQFWGDVLSWQVGACIPLPNGKYITLKDGLGDMNKCKSSGLLTRSLWPDGVRSDRSWVPFFMQESEQAVHDAVAGITRAGGTTLFPPMEADGIVSVVQDIDGATFGVYYRTDDPDVIKPSS